MSERDVLQELRKLLDRYTQPCDDACNHSQCPLLRDLRALVVSHSLQTAQRTVKPIVDLERQGESVGDLMEMRLRNNGLLDLDFDPFRRHAVRRSEDVSDNPSGGEGR